MLDRKQMGAELRDNGPMNGLKTDDKTIESLLDRVEQDKDFANDFYNLFWETIDAVKTEDDVEQED